MSKRKRKSVIIYNKKDFEKDEKIFNNAINGKAPVDWSSFKRLVIHDLCKSEILETESLGEYSLHDIELALQHPNRNYRMLLNASAYLMRKSPHYYKLNKFYSNGAIFNWWVDLYDVKENANMTALKKIYMTLCSKIENMNVKHEFKKIMQILPYQDIYCGVIVESTNDFFVQQINFNMCKLVKIQDGLFNFAIDLSRINPTNIGAYPDYIKRAFLDYKDGKISMWYMPPAEKQICIKLNTQWNFPYPIMINLVKDILDLDIYKKLKLQSARTDNYKAIAIEVPIDNTTVDKPLLTPETLSVFAEINKESMTDDIGLIHTLGSVGQPISFKDSSNTRNNVADCVDDIYNSSGITKELFNGSSSGTAVEMSLENDSGFIYDIYRQFERWMNRYIKLNKFNKQQFKFKFILIDMTIYNKDKVINRYKDACTLGVPVKGEYFASLGKTPSRVEGSFIIENDIFDLNNKMKPLSTSYTQTDNVGRPTNESKNKNLTLSGEQTKDKEENSKR